MSIIKAENLTFEYKSERGIRDINLTIDPGECFVLLGRNGSGKSTLTRLILGIERVSLGHLSVLGQNLNQNSRNHLENIGASLDTCVHWEDLSGWDNAYFAARVYGKSIEFIETRLKELFISADLWERAMDPVREYSYGMRRKLSILQAISHDPELLVLDEPTSGLDAHFLNFLSDLIRRRTQSGLSTWISGNDPEWVSGISTILALIDSGRIVFKGTEVDLLAEISPYQRVRICLGSYIEIPPPQVEKVLSFDQAGPDINVILKNNPIHIPEILEWIVHNGGKISRLEVSQGTLRDAFLLKTGRNIGS